LTEDPQEDPRIVDKICGVGRIGPTGIEWICIRKPHDTVYIRKSSHGAHRRGDPIFSNNPSVAKHYMVNRWPNRKKVNYGS
jgi:hypothetical protein